METGAWTLPFFLRRFHGAVYSDVGDAWTAGRHDFKLHAGAGAELRAEVVLGWILPTDLRLGCARGLERSPLAIPLVIRLTGTNEDLARRILSEHGLSATTSMDEGVRTAIAKAQEAAA